MLQKGDKSHLKEDQKKKTRERKHISKIIVLLAIFGIVVGFEMLLDNGYIPILKYVDTNYNHSLFAAIITLSTLSFTIISIIISIEGNKIYGIKLKEIIRFKSFPYDISEMIVVYLSLNLISIIALTYGWVMLITTTLAIDIFATAYYAGFLLYYISDDKRLKDIIEKEALSNSQLFKDKYINDWIIELKKSIIEKNEVLCNEYTALLKEIVIDKDCNTQIQANLPEIFRLSCDSFGFTGSIKLLMEINTKNLEDFDYEEIILDYFENLKLKDEKTIQNLKISGTINDIVEHKQLNDNVKINTLYWLFDSIFNNSIIKEDYKYILLSNYLNSLHRLYDKDNEGEIRLTVSLYILKHAVLLNENKESSQKVFKIITKSLASNNIYSKEECYIELLAYILRAFYFYLYFDNSIKRNQKKMLEEIFIDQEQTVDGITVSFEKLVYSYSNKILEVLLKSSVYDKEYHDIMDHFSPLMGVREVVWSNKNKLLFAFCYYIAFGYNYTIFPISNYINVKSPKATEINLLRELLTYYDYKNNKVEKHVEEYIDNLIKLLNVNKKYGILFIKDTFQEINKKLQIIDINSKIISENLTNEEIIEKVSDLISRKTKGIEFDNSKVFNNTEDFYLNPVIIKDDIYFADFVSNRICSATIEAMNHRIDNALIPLRLTFDKSGILELTSWLKRYTYKYGNYKFIDDFAFKNDIRETLEYKELSDLINKIKIENTCEIDFRFFIKEEKLIVSYNIKEIEYKELSDKQTNDYIKNYRISDNMYKISNVIYNRSEAINFIKKHYKILYSTIQVGLNIDKGSGIRIIY